MIIDKQHCFRFPENGSDPKLNKIVHNVYFYGEGPAVLLMHELPGMTPLFLRLATRVADAGFKVYAPLFFGEPNETLFLGGAADIPLICIRREFELLRGNRDSRITPWLRALIQHIDAENRVKRHAGDEEIWEMHRGIGLIGLCLTGNLVLSLMSDPAVRVPVMCEPALPFLHAHSLGVTESDVRCAVAKVPETPLQAYRFTKDCLSGPERFVALRAAFKAVPERLHACEIPSGNGAPWFIPKNAHSVLTKDYPSMDDPNHPVNHVLDHVLGQFSLVLKNPGPRAVACPPPPA